jgi:dTDP-4-amino-4,6-dideoxygalactose transaminase
VFHLFTIRLERRDALAEHLKKNGIGSGVYYPIPVHLQPAYAGHAARVPLPISDRASREALSLPMFSELSETDAGRVVDAVRGFFR